jgi:hypothetical protein
MRGELFHFSDILDARGILAPLGRKITTEVISMKYEEVVKLWGYNALIERGYEVESPDTVRVDLSYEEQGYCETCSYTEGVVRVSSGSQIITLTSYAFSEMLNELVSLSVKNADTLVK